VITMPVMHEQVHQWAREQQQKWQRTQQVGTVFSQQKKPCYRQECHKNPVESPWGAMWIVLGMIVMFHHVPL
jgi:hypothetical protein